MSEQLPEGTRIEESIDVENAAEAYLETFRANGVDYFFNSPGTEFAPFWDQFAATSEDGFPASESGVKYVGCRHEEVAIQMAMGYTLLTGEPQVVGFHVNVGSLHAAMSIHGAYRSRIPMVVLTSHADTHERELPGGTPGSHYLHFNAPGGFENYFARYVKWLAHPERNHNATNYLARGFRVARTSPAGPVLVNLSRELLYDESVDRCHVVREVEATPPSPGRAVVERIASELQTAENPLIISGMTGRDEDAAAHLVTLAERLRAPVIENPKWHHGIPVEHPLSLGDRTFVSTYLDDGVDLVFVVDSERPWYPPAGSAPDDATVVMLSPEPDQAKLDYWNYPVDLLCHGDPAVTLGELLEHVSERGTAGPVDWEAEHDDLRASWNRHAEAGREDVPIDPFWLCRELDRALPDDAIVVEETTVHKSTINNLVQTRDRTYVGAGRALAGGRGGGLGIALGAKLAEPDRPVVALVGDGAYHYNPVSAALGAAQEHGLPFMTVIFDNHGYASQRGSHERHFPDGVATRTGTFPGTSIQPGPDYVQQALGWGAQGAVVEDPNEISAAVEEGLDHLSAGSAVVLDVVLSERSPRDEVEPPT